MSEKFEYKYEAPTIEERKEIDSIRRQYMPQDKSMTKIERLRSLDRKVKSIPQAISISIGVIGLLTFGLSMTFFLEWVNYWYVGIPFSVVGTIMMLINYPLYNRISEKLKEKYGEEIVKLSNEILEEDK